MWNKVFSKIYKMPFSLSHQPSPAATPEKAPFENERKREQEIIINGRPLSPQNNHPPARHEAPGGRGEASNGANELLT
jgi:hypothetical protein